MNAEASIAYSPGLANDAMNGVDDEHHKDTGGSLKNGYPKIVTKLDWTDSYPYWLVNIMPP